MSTPHWCKETDRTWRGSYGPPKKAALHVWLLWHTHLSNDVKLIGIYESAEAAEAARLRLADQPGFKDHPNGWYAEPYELGKDHWAEGFDTV